MHPPNAHLHGSTRRSQGDAKTAFTIHADEELSFGENWLLVDLQKPLAVFEFAKA